jgi:phosphoribosyl-AMP cyclohydrolase
MGASRFTIHSSQFTIDEFFAAIRFDPAGLVPAIVQDAATGQVLMMAWMNTTSLHRTLALGETVFWSRSRQELWHKGATSGNVQRIVDLRVDCDGDTLLLLVEPAGPACHTGAVSCFYRSLALPTPNE